MTLTPRRCLLLLLILPVLVSAAPLEPQAKREFTIDARQFEFEPARIEVEQGDLVRITLVAGDIPHSLTIDAYRIAKRAEPGKQVTFEFLADREGTFRFYCNLTIDEGCRRMAGELVVLKKR